MSGLEVRYPMPFFIEKEEVFGNRISTGPGNPTFLYGGMVTPELAQIYCTDLQFVLLTKTKEFATA